MPSSADQKWRKRWLATASNQWYCTTYCESWLITPLCPLSTLLALDTYELRWQLGFCFRNRELMDGAVVLRSICYRQHAKWDSDRLFYVPWWQWWITNISNRVTCRKIGHYPGLLSRLLSRLLYKVLIPTFRIYEAVLICKTDEIVSASQEACDCRIRSSTKNPIANHVSRALLVT